MKSKNDDQIAEAINRNFTSPNCSDSNFEAANVVDGLYQIARALFRLAEVIEKKSDIEVL